MMRGAVRRSRSYCAIFLLIVLNSALLAAGRHDDPPDPDPCLIYTNCTSCTNLYPGDPVGTALNCGWCIPITPSSPNQTGICLGGSSVGATDWVNYHCLSWSYHSWSVDNTTVETCANPWVYEAYDASLPPMWFGAIFGIIFVSLTVIVRICICPCYSSCVPTEGLRVNSGASARDYTNIWLRVLPFSLIGLSILMKIIAISLDEWDINNDLMILPIGEESIYSTEQWVGHQLFGVLTVRQYSQSYDHIGITTHRDTCKYSERYSGFSPHVKCETFLYSAVLTIMMGLFSSFFSLLIFLRSLVCLASKARVYVWIKSMWSLASMAHLFSFAAVWYWLLGVHLILQDYHHATRPHASWILFFSSWILDLIVLIFYRQAVQYTLPHHHLLPYQQSYDTQPPADYLSLNGEPTRRPSPLPPQRPISLIPREDRYASQPSAHQMVYSTQYPHINQQQQQQQQQRREQRYHTINYT